MMQEGEAPTGAEVRDRILVSACLLGRPVRYDGSAKTLSDAIIARWSAEGRLVAICPEISAGFATPRPPAEIEPGAEGGDVLAGAARVIESTGRDVTALYIAGAQNALNVARRYGCRFALLTDGSPSCGSRRIHDGTFEGRTRQGEGVTAALLLASGIEVFAESGIESLARRLDSRDGKTSPDSAPSGNKSIGS